MCVHVELKFYKFPSKTFKSNILSLSFVPHPTPIRYIYTYIYVTYLCAVVGNTCGRSART